MNAVLYKALVAARSVRVNERAIHNLSDQKKLSDQSTGSEGSPASLLPECRPVDEMAILRAQIAKLRADVNGLMQKRAQDDPLYGLRKTRPHAVDVIELVACEHDLTIEEMLGQNRHKPIVRARQIAIYLTRRLTLLSFPQIGRAFADRDHSTVVHAFKAIVKLRREDPDFDAFIGRLESIFKHDADAYPQALTPSLEPAALTSPAAAGSHIQESAQ